MRTRKPTSDIVNFRCPDLRERGILTAAAMVEGVSVSEFIRRAVIPAARQRLREELQAEEREHAPAA